MAKKAAITPDALISSRNKAIEKGQKIVDKLNNLMAREIVSRNKNLHTDARVDISSFISKTLNYDMNSPQASILLNLLIELEANGFDSRLEIYNFKLPNGAAAHLIDITKNNYIYADIIPVGVFTIDEFIKARDSNFLNEIFTRSENSAENLFAPNYNIERRLILDDSSSQKANPYLEVKKLHFVINSSWEGIVKEHMNNKTDKSPDSYAAIAGGRVNTEIDNLLDFFS